MSHFFVAPGKFKLIGKGQCRGPNWQFGKWPVDKGTKTRQKCANVCKKRPGCVAFDLSPPDSTADKEDVKKVRIIFFFVKSFSLRNIDFTKKEISIESDLKMLPFS